MPVNHGLTQYSQLIHVCLLECPKRGFEMRSVRYWFDTSQRLVTVDPSREGEIDWSRILPFIGIHVACLAVYWVGISPIAVGIAAFLYFIRMFAITAFYHRYFSHKAFKTSRLVQFIFAVIGAASTQRGPLWWAAHHRAHHRHSDTDKDPHTPAKGFLWSHMGWFLSRKHFDTDFSLIPDLKKYKELVWLDRHDMFVPFLLAVSLFVLGSLLSVWFPSLETSGWQLLVWGYFISTVVLIHATLCINSLAHWFGKKRYATRDDSRNNFVLAIITLGEGWHNNHHYYPASARQGFFWWEVDISFYMLKLMSFFGLVWDLKSVPEKKRNNYKTANTAKGLSV